MPPASPPLTDRRRLAWLIAAITLAGLALRLPLLGSPLFGDELGTWYSVVGHGPRRTFELIAGEQEVTPPLYFLLAWAAGKLGDPTVSLRLVPLLAGVATIPLTYLLGARTVGPRAGIVGAALVALSPMMIFFSTEARAYALVTLLALLSTLALLRALDSGAKRWWAAYALLSLAAMYTHYTVGFVLIAQVVWALFARPRARRPLLAANALAALGFLPWLGEFREDGRSACSHIIDAAHPFGARMFFDDLGHLAVGHPILGLDRLPGTVVLVAFCATLAVALVALAAHARTDSRRPSSGLALVAALAAAPLAIALYSAVSSNSIYAPRNLLTALPALALLVGAIVTAPRSRALRVGATAVVVGAMAVAAAMMLDRDNRRPDYGALAAFIERTGVAGDVVVNTDFPSTPGPYSPVDAALLLAGRPPATQPVLNIGSPPLADLVRAHEIPGPQACTSQFAAPPAPEEIWREAARRGAGKRVYVVTRLYSGDHDQGLPRNLVGLPPSFRLVETRSFPGLGSPRLTVAVYRDGAAA